MALSPVSSEVLPLIPALEVPESASPAIVRHVETFTDEKINDVSAFGALSTVIEVSGYDREEMMKKRRRQLRGLAGGLGIGFAQIIATSTMLSLAWFSESPTQAGVSEWMASSTMGRIAIWALVYALVFQGRWVLQLQDFALKRGRYAPERYTAEGRKKKVKKTPVRRAFFILDIATSIIGGFLIGVMTAEDRAASPHIWWLCLGLFGTIYFFIALFLIAMILAGISQATIFIFGLESYLE